METNDLSIEPRPAAVANPIGALRRFARPRAQLEQCELCAAPLADRHQHLLEPSTRRLRCACDACAVLFDSAAAARYRRVPRDVEFWPEFQLGDERWADLGVPISLAFFFHSTPAGQVRAVYPSPAGATEVALAAEAWDALVGENPALAALAPDVEALMAYRIGGAREHYRVPIDECYRLVGLVRTHWRGLSGGTEVWRHLAEFFAGLKRRATGGAAHA